jgi:hypothetical protein
MISPFSNPTNIKIILKYSYIDVPCALYSGGGSCIEECSDELRNSILRNFISKKVKINSLDLLLHGEGIFRVKAWVEKIVFSNIDSKSLTIDIMRGVVVDIICSSCSKIMAEEGKC